MKKLRRISALVIALTILLFAVPSFPSQSAKQDVCVLQTNMGTLAFKFFEAEAPQTSKQIQKLVREGFYNGKEFYRVVKGHVIQTGGGEAPNLPPEFSKKPHLVGTVGLGRDEDVNSGNSEFYICVAPRPHLDGKYTVFGHLIEGYDTLEKISEVEVEEKWEGPDKKLAMHKPKKPVVIEKAWIEERDISPKVPSVKALGKYDFWHYYEYEELTNYLHDMAKAYPELAEVRNAPPGMYPENEPAHEFDGTFRADDCPDCDRGYYAWGSSIDTMYELFGIFSMGDEHWESPDYNKDGETRVKLPRVLGYAESDKTLCLVRVKDSSKKAALKVSVKSPKAGHDTKEITIQETKKQSLKAL